MLIAVQALLLIQFSAKARKAACFLMKRLMNFHENYDFFGMVFILWSSPSMLKSTEHPLLTVAEPGF